MQIQIDLDNLSEYRDKIFSHCETMQGALASTLKDSEPIFMRVGQELQVVNSDAVGLSKLTGNIAELVGDESVNGFLGSVGSLARESIEQLQIYESQVGSNIQRVEKNASHIRSLYSKAPIIRKISKTLNILTLSMAMESRRTEECEKLFGYFVGEIKELVENVNQISRNMFDESNASFSSQVAALDRILERRKQLAAIADKAHIVVEENHKKTEQVIKLSMLVLNDVNNHSKAISDRVGEVVFALQFGDIIRQQLEHILEAFQNIEAIIKEDNSNSSEEEKRNIFGKAYSVLHLQAAQLKQVATEIEKAQKKIASAFKGISNEVDSLVKKVSTLGLASSLKSNNDAGSMEILMAGIEDLGIIMEKGSELTNQIDEVLLQSARETSSLSGHLAQIEDISEDLHIKAINAVIMSKRLTKGGVALSILAQEISDISQESDEFAAEIMGIVKNISSFSEPLTVNPPTGVAEQRAENKGDRNPIKEKTHEVSDTYSTIKENSNNAIRNAKTLMMNINSIESDLKYITRMKEQFDNFSNEIGEMLLYLDSFKNCGQEKGIEQFSDRYTMKSERDVHVTAMGKKVSSDHNIVENQMEIFEVDSSAHNTSSDSINQKDMEFEENIELF